MPFCTTGSCTTLFDQGWVGSAPE